MTIDDQSKINQPGVNVEVDGYSGKLEEIDAQVKKLLSDEKLFGDEGAKKELGDIITNDFLSGLNDIVRDSDRLNQFKDKIDGWFKKYYQNRESIPEEIQPLLDVFGKMGIELVQTSVDNIPKEPELNLSLVLNGVESKKIDKPENQKGNFKFFNNIDKIIGDEGETRLGKTINMISGLKQGIGKVDITSDNVPEEVKNKINSINDLLKAIQDVINNKSPDNVKKLQDYIFSNLDGDADKKLFQQKNKFDSKTNEFDGKFGESTLEGLNKVLNKISQYIQKIPEYLKQLKENADKKIASEEMKGQNNSEAEKQKRLNEVLEGLKLKEIEINEENRKNYHLPEEGKIYEREGDSPKYYYIENSEYVVYVPVDTLQQIRRLEISKYEKGMDYSAVPWVDQPEDKGGDMDIAKGQNEKIDAENLINTAIATLGLKPVGNVDRVSLGLPSNGTIFMVPGQNFYYYVSQDNKLVRMSPNFGEFMKYYLDLPSFSKDNINPKWLELEEDLGYPPVNEIGRQYYENILKKALRGTRRLGNADCKIKIDYDPLDKRQEYKLSAFGYSNFIDVDMLTTGWLFNGNDHLSKDLRIYTLINNLVAEFEGKMNGCRFELENGNELVRIDSTGKKKVIIKKSEWKKDYGELPKENVDRFCNYLNKHSGGIYFETQTISPRASTSTPAETTSSSSVHVNVGTDTTGSQEVQQAVVQSASQNHLGDATAALYASEIIGGINGQLMNNIIKNVHEYAQSTGDLLINDSSANKGPDGLYKIDLGLIDGKTMPDKFGNPNEINNSCFRYVIRKSDVLSSKFQQLIMDVFNSAVDKVSVEEDKTKKEKDIKILNLFKDGFMKSDINSIYNGFSNIDFVGSLMTEDVDMSALRAFCAYYNVEIDENFQKLGKEISERSKEYLQHEAEGFFLELEHSLTSGLDKMMFMNTFKDNYIKSYVKTKTYSERIILNGDLKKSLDSMTKHIDWKGNVTEKGQIEYHYVGETVMDRSYHQMLNGRGVVTFSEPGSSVETFIGHWNNGRLVSCESYGENINIEYNEGIPYFVSMDGKRLPIKLQGQNDLGMIANKLNYMVSKLNSLESTDGKLTVEKVSILFGKLFVRLSNGKIMNLKDNVKETLFIDDSLNNDYISDWFLKFLNMNIHNLDH